MNKFLNKLKKEKKLGLVEPSEDICDSYSEKSANCLKSAKLLLQNNLYENSISESYYSMYNSLLALLFKVGIKSENHSASIILFNELFGDKELWHMIKWAKEERIDKQYYIQTSQVDKITKESCGDMILKTENFSLKMRVIATEMNNKEVLDIRDNFLKLFS